MHHHISELPIPEDARRDIEAMVEGLVARFSELICKIILFGSFATCTYQPDSDVDLLVVEGDGEVDCGGGAGGGKCEKGPD